MYSENDYRYYQDDALYHHGIKGMKWGVRRYQNEDGTLTPEGRKRYGGNGYEESYKKRKNRAIKGHKFGETADKYYSKADRALDKGNYEKQAKMLTQAKFYDELKKTSFKDLSKSEIEVGRRYYEESLRRSGAETLGWFVGGIPGSVGAGLTMQAINSLSSEGRAARAADRENQRAYEEKRRKYMEKHNPYR